MSLRLAPPREHVLPCKAVAVLVLISHSGYPTQSSHIPAGTVYVVQCFPENLISNAATEEGKQPKEWFHLFTTELVRVTKSHDVTKRKKKWSGFNTASLTAAGFYIWWDSGKSDFHISHTAERARSHYLRHQSSRNRSDQMKREQRNWRKRHPVVLTPISEWHRVHDSQTCLWLLDFREVK